MPITYDSASATYDSSSMAYDETGLAWLSAAATISAAGTVVPIDRWEWSDPEVVESGGLVTGAAAVSGTASISGAGDIDPIDRWDWSAPTRAYLTGPSPVPDLLAEINFGGVWQDVYPWLRSFSISRGRNRERERMGAGTATLVFDNRDGTFDRDNPDGPFFGDIRPSLPVRLYARVQTRTTAFAIGSSWIGGGDALGGGGTYDLALFTGRTEGGPMSFVQGADSYVTWSAVDASKRLNRDRSATGYGSSAELTGERVTAVLDGATPTWPETERDIAEGVRTVQIETGSLGRYDYMLQVAESEGGLFFIGANGYAIFRDSTYAPLADTVPYGDIFGEQRHKGLTFDDDDKEVFNAVTVTANALADQTVEDLASQVEFGRADLSLSTLLSNTPDMSDLASSVLGTYAQPQRRVGQLVIGARTTDWHRVLSKELGERVTVRHRPMYGGLFEQELAIQGIAVRSPSKFEWEVTWNLAPPLGRVYNPNLLTENQSTMETSTAGWVVTFVAFDFLGYTYVIDGLASGSVPLAGTYCLEMRATGVPSIGGEVETTPYTTAPVVVGETYRASAWVRSYWGSIFWYVAIKWYSSGGSLVSRTDGAIIGLSGGYPDGFTDWRQGTVEGVAPVGAAYGVVLVNVSEQGEYWIGGYIDRPHFIDSVELRHVGI